MKNILGKGFTYQYRKENKERYYFHINCSMHLIAFMFFAGYGLCEREESTCRDLQMLLYNRYAERLLNYFYKYFAIGSIDNYNHSNTELQISSSPVPKKWAS